MMNTEGIQQNPACPIYQPIWREELPAAILCIHFLRRPTIVFKSKDVKASSNENNLPSFL